MNQKKKKIWATTDSAYTKEVFCAFGTSRQLPAAVVGNCREKPRSWSNRMRKGLSPR